jgi:hypothetical protein
VLDDEEAVEQPEGHRWHDEEVEGHNDLTVILEKGQPAFARVTPATDSPKVPGHASFRDLQPEFQEFSVDLRSTPARILVRHPADERTDFVGDLGPTALRPGPPTPVEAETGAMPADDGLGLHDEEDVGPVGPNAAQGSPEEPVQPIQTGTGPLPLENCDLLPQGEDLQGGVLATAEEDSDCAQEGKDELEHKP